MLTYRYALDEVKRRAQQRAFDRFRQEYSQCPSG